MAVLEVLAVDPGVLSGIVLGLNPEPGVIEPLHWWEIEQQDTCDLIVKWCNTPGLNARKVLVIERFIPRGGPITFVPASLEIIGVARWAAKVAGVRFVTQSPADMKQIRPLVVKQFPKIGRGGKGHAKDALAHLYLFS